MRAVWAGTPFFSKPCEQNVKLDGNAWLHREITTQVFGGMLNILSTRGI